LTNETNKIMEIYKKLLEAKKEIGKISKDSTNPFFKSKYFDINGLLEHVEPIMQKNGLLILQPIEAEWVKTQIFDVETGEKVCSEIHLGNITDPQKLGSAITYYRRYTLQSLLGLQAEDDDGNKASAPVKRIDYISKLHNCKTLGELQKVYTSIIKPTNQEFELKEKLKLTLK
jgi:hypothetical protein